MSSLYHELSPHIWEWALCTMNYHPIFESELFVSWTITPYWSVLYLFGGFPSGSCAIMKCCFCTFSASPVASELPKIPFLKLVPEGNSQSSRELQEGIHKSLAKTRCAHVWDQNSPIQIKLEDMLCERNQVQKQKHCRIPLLWNTQNRQIQRDRK